MRWLHRRAPLLLALASCGEVEPAVVLWPPIAADSWSFIVTFDEGGRQVVGPIGGEGPAQNLSFSAGATMAFINFDQSWVLERHHRIDAERRSELALVDRPASCENCTGACRGENDEQIFHPLDANVQVFLFDEEELSFLPSSSAELPRDLWLSVPARWGCTTLESTREARYVDEWASSGQQIVTRRERLGAHRGRRGHRHLDGCAELRHQAVRPT